MKNIILFSTLIVGAAVPMFADTTFNLVDNVFSNGATATGTVNIDTTAGTFTSADVTLVAGANTYLFTGTPTTQSTFDNGSQYFAEYFNAGGNELVVDLPGSSLVGFSGGNLCSTSNLCDGYAGGYAMPTGPQTANAFSLASGSLVAATPEPSSLVLLGTGVLGAFGVARRRWSSSASS